jgi:hypothetical protein
MAQNVEQKLFMSQLCRRLVLESPAFSTCHVPVFLLRWTSSIIHRFRKLGACLFDFPASDDSSVKNFILESPALSTCRSLFTSPILTSAVSGLLETICNHKSQLTILQKYTLLILF